jgi:hypothetical protein
VLSASEILPAAWQLRVLHASFVPECTAAQQEQECRRVPEREHLRRKATERQQRKAYQGLKTVLEGRCAGHRGRDQPVSRLLVVVAHTL